MKETLMKKKAKSISLFLALMKIIILKSLKLMKKAMKKFFLKKFQKPLQPSLELRLLQAVDCVLSQSP
jgi:hypothetical protein